MHYLFGRVVFYSVLLNHLAHLTGDDARAVIERAIESQGGAQKVAKLRCMRIKVEGTTNFVPSQPNLPFTIEDIWKMPDQYKTTSTIAFMGEKHVQTEVIDGNKGWSRIDGVVQDLSADAISEMKEQKYAEDLDRLGFLKTRGLQLSTVSDIQVGGKTASGVLIRSPVHKDVKLYFDKASGLLVKREHRLLDGGSGKETLQEVYFSDYQPKDGLKHYQRIVVHRDGKTVIEGRVIELEFFPQLDGKAFAKPS